MQSVANAFTYTTKKIHVVRQGKVLSSFWLSGLSFFLYIGCACLESAEKIKIMPQILKSGPDNHQIIDVALPIFIKFTSARITHPYHMLEFSKISVSPMLNSILNPLKQIAKLQIKTSILLRPNIKA